MKRILLFIGIGFILGIFSISHKYVYADSSYSYNAHQADFESTDSMTNFQDMDDVPPVIDLSSGNRELNFYGIWYIKDGEIREENYEMCTFINDDKLLKFTSIPKLTINEKNLFQILYTTDGITFSETIPDLSTLRGFRIILKDWTGSYSSNTQPMVKYEYSMTANREYIIENNLLDINCNPFSGNKFSTAAQTYNYSSYNIKFHYVKAKAADVTVKYVDENGKEIHTTQTISGNVGDSYDASTNVYKLAIDGYDLDVSNLPNNATGTLSDTSQTVTYYYKSSLKLTVPVAIEFGQYKLGTDNTVLTWNKSSKVEVEGASSSQWDLYVDLKSGSSLKDYIKIGNQAISDQPQKVIDGAGPMDVTSEVSSDEFVKVDYTGVKQLRKDTGDLEWTLTPSIKEVSE